MIELSCTERDEALAPVRPDELSAILSVRLHAGNPWLLDRLANLLKYYNPAPKFVVVDFGSEQPQRDQLQSLCSAVGAKFLHIPDYDVFSLSQARNAGALAAETNFLYFTDVDFLSERDFFDQLAKGATASSMRSRVDVILDLPAYHLSRSTTNRLASAQANGEDVSTILLRLASDAQYSNFGQIVDFVAPYSNNFLVRSDFFSLVGGYHTGFRGHGSEDFEFFIRASIISGNLPLPDNILRDWDAPTKPGFWKSRPYFGFRSLNQLISSRAERLGLRTFHLWHPTRSEDSWRQSNDWKRSRLTQFARPYVDQHHAVLQVDNLPRAKSMVCVCKDHSHWAYFLPFRALGYKLTPIFDDTPDALAVAASQLENCEFDALAVFNPYMKSHAKFYTAFLRAKELGREIFVVERGALPNTVYYSDDVSYNSHWFSEEAFAQENLSEFEISTAEKYITDLRSGNQLLESGDSRSTTDKKYEAFRSIKRTKIFIPLQLHDDMAVTKYVRAAQSYTDFVEAIIPTARANQEILFLIKPHPLSKYAFPAMPENVIMADREDNIHSLLDCCSSVICYNSGVGLLAACHGRRLITIGNAFYNHSGIGHFADNLKDAVAKCTQRVASPDVQIVTRLIGTFLFRRYSVFWATDVIQEFKDRKAHKYVNIKVLRFVTKAGILNLNWEAASNPFGDRSYAAGIANFGDLGISGKKAEAAPPAPRLSEEEIRTKALTAFSSRLFDVAEGHFIAAFDISRKPAYLRAAAEAALLRGQKATAIQHLQKAAGIAQKKGGVLKRLREMNRPAMLRLLPQHPYDVTSV